VTTIGFIGLGAMGRPMLNCLLRAGHEVLAYDLSPAAVERAVGDGATAVASAAEAAAGSELAFTMLPRAQDVLAAVLGPDGVASGIRPGSVLLDTSTIDVGTVRSLEAPLAAVGAILLEGGVSGSPKLAGQCGVTFMVGGPEDVVGRFRPVFEAFAATIVYAGPLGAAKTMKLANNMVAAILTAALAEAFTLITANGADPVVAKRAMEGSWAKSLLLDLKPPLPGLVPDSVADRGYEAEFSIDYMAKDLEAVLESARQAGVVLMTAGLVRQLFVAAGARGDGSLDVSGLIRTTRGFGRTTG
jgi:3-hydroxyisobutyrate dehydrogenase